MPKLIARAPCIVKGQGDKRPGDTFEAQLSDVHPEGAAEAAPVEDPAMRELADDVKARRAAADRAERAALKGGAK